MNKISLKNKVLKYIAPVFLETKQLDSDFIEKIPKLNISKMQVKYLVNSTYNVIYLESENTKGYFRECRLHKAPEEYISDIIDDYFAYVSYSKDAISLKKEILKYLEKNRNMKKFLNMGVRNDENSRIAQFFKNPCNTEIIGIPNDHSEKLGRELQLMMQFVWGEIYTYILSRGTKYNNYQVINTNRQIATYELAKFLDAEELIPNTRYIKLCIDGTKTKLGTLMDIAPGISPEELLENERKKINPKLQRQFIRLNLLDVLCRHTDHRPGHNGNYNVSFNKLNEVYGVCAFDNDAPTSFLPSSSIKFITSAMTTPLVNSNGTFERPFICEDISKILLKVSRKDINKLLERYLTYIQREFIYLRLKAVKKAIIKSKMEKSISFLEEDMWSYKTIEKEITMCKTNKIISYLYSFLEMTY